jgi:ATP-binding cassette subfamily F protein 3
LKKVEEEIATLESRGEELDEQIQQPEIASNVGKLMAIHKEKEAVDARLAELYERWEQLAEDM